LLILQLYGWHCLSFCQKPDAVIKHGTNRGGTARLRCRTCETAFTPNPNPRQLSPEKDQLIVNGLAERTSPYDIARAFGVSRVTIRKIRKRRQGS